ncbi:MAG: cytochrome b [Alphaproteobacteria bacterium]
MSSKKSTPTQYGSVAIAIHWLSAIVIAVLIVLGLIGANLENDSGIKPLTLVVHIVLGVTVLLMTLGRVAWWRFADRRPDPVIGMPVWQEVVARSVHILFYVAVLALAGSGIALVATSGAVPVLFGSEGSLPDFWDFAPRLPHRIIAFALIGLLFFHIGAAIYHQAVMKDRLMDRMLRARPEQLRS